LNFEHNASALITIPPDSHCFTVLLFMIELHSSARLFSIPILIFLMNRAISGSHKLSIVTETTPNTLLLWQ